MRHAARAAACAAKAAQSEGFAYITGNFQETGKYQAIRAASEAAREALAANPNTARGISRDLELLRDAAKEHDDFSSVPAHFFALRSEFNMEPQIEPHREPKSIVTVVSFIELKLLEEIQRNPKYMYLLSPRQFEELIAELFSAFGYMVELTACTKDGGRDIIAVSNNIVAVRYLIECKRYKPDRKVGVVPVRALHGIVASERATKGILATTSTFTKGAIEHLERHPWLLDGRDFNGIVDWLEKYQTFQMWRDLR